jgi:hypothetical protein
MERLLPHISSEMPRVAESLPWLVWLDALLFVCTVLGVVSLIYCEVRLTKESSKILISRALPRTLRDCARAFSILQWVCIGSGLIMAAWWAIKTNSGAGSPALPELVFGVLIGLVLMPIYLAGRLFQLALSKLVDRIEELGRT